MKVVCSISAAKIETLEEVIECLVENFSIETQGICDQQTLFEILIYAASSGDNIENTAKLFLYPRFLSKQVISLNKIGLRYNPKPLHPFSS